MSYKYQYGVFIAVDRKKDLAPLLDNLTDMSIPYDLPSLRLPVRMSEYRILNSEVEL